MSLYIGAPVQKVHIDFESYSEFPIKDGAWGYSCHPSTDVICMYYAYDKEAPRQWLPGQPLPDFVKRPLNFIWVAHNVSFEHAICVNSLGWQVPPWSQWEDTMARAGHCALPQGLDRVGKVLKVPAQYQKDKRGKQLIALLCLPNRDTGLRNNDPFLLEEMYEYCGQDVVSEEFIDRLLPPITGMERKVWELSQKINARGIPMDTKNIENANFLYGEIQKTLVAELEGITGLENTNSSVQFLGWMHEQGHMVPNVQATTLEEYQAENHLSAELDRAIELKILASKTPLAKYDAMLRTIDRRDDRIRWAMLYYGAGTGRWSGQIINPQNIPRPTIKDPEGCIEMLKFRDLDIIRMTYGEPIGCLLSCLRGMIKAGPGNRLIVADLSAIEARILAWMAGQNNVVEVFRGHGKIYEYTASLIYNKDLGDVTKDERAIGKVGNLALGYQGGVGAYMKMAKTYRVEISENAADVIKVNWREANPRIVKFWAKMEECAIGAVQQRGAIHQYRGIKFVADKNFLKIRLLSGRVLYYYKPKIVEGKFGGDQVQVLARGDNSAAFGPKNLYGGLIAENIAQATAADILRHGMLNADEAGYDIVMHVHDEIVAEMPYGKGSVEELAELMCIVPDWAEGLPLAAAGYESKRFKKD